MFFEANITFIYTTFSFLIYIKAFCGAKIAILIDKFNCTRTFGTVLPSLLIIFNETFICKLNYFVIFAGDVKFAVLIPIH